MMDSIRVAIDDRLANVGDTLPIKEHVAIRSYELGGRELVLPDGLSVDVVLTNAGEGILATGIVRARVEASCDRCLDDTSFDVAGEVDEYYLFHEPDAGVMEDDEEEGPDFSLVGADSTIDLADAVASAFVMDVPFVILCKDDCAGLCPVCGENLNHVDCGHAQAIEQQRLEASPFAVLKDLDLKD